jgi:hypothetical protein
MLVLHTGALFNGRESAINRALDDSTYCKKLLLRNGTTYTWDW